MGQKDGLPLGGTRLSVLKDGSCQSNSAQGSGEKNTFGGHCDCWLVPLEWLLSGLTDRFMSLSVREGVAPFINSGRFILFFLRYRINGTASLGFQNQNAPYEG